MSTKRIIKINFIFLSVAFSIPLIAFAQGEPHNLLTWLPLLTFVITTVVGILNLYFYKKMATLKEDVLNLVQSRINSEINVLDIKMEKMATTKELEAFKQMVDLQLKFMMEKLNDIKVEVTKGNKDGRESNRERNDDRDRNRNH